MMACLDSKILSWVLALFVVLSAVPLVLGLTDPRDGKRI